MGVGPLNGLGGALSKKFAQEGMEVFVSGRSKEKLDIVVNQINKLGLKAHSFKADTRDINQIQNLLDFVGEGLNLAIYNVGNNMPGNIVDMDPEYFHRLCDDFRSEHLWKNVNGEWRLRHTVGKNGTDDN